MFIITFLGECCFYIFKRCCVASKQVDYFNDVADLINDIFKDEAFVPTDLAAALILLAEKNNVTQLSLTQEELRYVSNSLQILQFDDFPFLSQYTQNR